MPEQTPIPGGAGGQLRQTDFVLARAPGAGRVSAAPGGTGPGPGPGCRQRGGGGGSAAACGWARQPSGTRGHEPLWKLLPERFCCLRRHQHRFCAPRAGDYTTRRLRCFTLRGDISPLRLMWPHRASGSRTAEGCPLPPGGKAGHRAPQTRGRVRAQRRPLPRAPASLGARGPAPAPGSAGGGEGWARRRGPGPGDPGPRWGRAAAAERGGEAPQPVPSLPGV